MFEKDIKRVAIPLAILMFFVMAFVGWASDLSPGTSGTRAVIGAVVVYCLVRLGGTLIVNVCIRALVNEQMRRYQKTEQD
jgi:hypothetical protein